MAEMLQLDKAAALVGKSEVTLRRLVKAGKIPFEKEKTLTGFIYRVDPRQVRAYYQGREGEILAETSPGTLTPAPIKEESAGEARAVRVPVAGESGNAWEYWQKKADLYEEKYHLEVDKHAATREELGVWRGRAEQAQSMLVKLLPGPGEVVIQSGPTASEKKKSEESSSGLAAVLILGIILIVAVVAGGVIYLRLSGHY